jgi:uncharacterized protein
VTPVGFVVAGAAAFVAGGINAIAGGGTMVSFPALLALGVAGVTANATNTVALCLGYLGGAWAQRDDLLGWGRRARPLVAAGIVGGLIGSILLVRTSERLFTVIVPGLILLACFLLGLQRQIRSWLGIGASSPASEARDWSPASAGAVVVSGIYGGYFGAGLGILLVALLGIVLHGSLASLNALKSVLSLAINLSAAVFLSASGHVNWALVPVMAVASLIGGVLGGRIASRIDPVRLRRVVVTFGVLVAIRLILAAV